MSYLVAPGIIDGTEVHTDTVSEVRSPFSGEVVARVAQCDVSHVDEAVAVALRNHHHGALPAHQRAAVLDRAAELLTERNEVFAQAISTESGKPITAARLEARRAVDTLRLSAAAARTFSGEVVAMDATESGVGKLGYVKRVPIGVVAAISPFNFPLNLVCHKVAPAVAAGCPIVLKPASATPSAAILLAQLFHEAGLPAGWLNVVPCPGSIADRLVTHDDVAMITFTGSPEVGWSIRARAPRKRVSLELGNNAPVIVCSDADLELAATKIVAGGYGFSGQTCISVQRVYAHESISSELRQLVVDKVAKLQVGDPSDEGTVVSALINAGETQRVKSWIDEAVEAGASIGIGGTVDHHGVLAPTVLFDVAEDMNVCRNEVFGPVVGMATFVDLTDAISRSNASRYGLQAAVFTTDISTALRCADTLDFGGVVVNDMPTFRADQQPYGGLRDSGNTREGPAYTIQEMTERRMITIAH